MKKTKVVLPAKREPGVIGGSAIAAIVGKSSRRSPFDVWAEATGKLRETPSDELAEHMQMGQLLEPAILEEYGRRVKAVDLVPMFNVLVVHPDRPWQTGHPDGDRAKAGIVPEAKYAPFRSRDFGEPGTDQVPAEYAIQNLWYQSIQNREAGDIAVLLPGKIAIFTVYRNRRLEEFLLEKGYRFYLDHIQPDIPPPVSATEGAAEYIRQNFPLDVEPLRVALDSEIALAKDLADLRRQGDVIAEERETVENILKITIGKASAIAGGDFKISWKKSKDGVKVDWQAIATELGAAPDLIRKHTATKLGNRRFLPSGPLFKDGGVNGEE